MNVQRICFRHQNGELRRDFDLVSRRARTPQRARRGRLVDIPTAVGRSDFVEVFGPEYENASVFPAEVSEGVVVAFAVDDIVGARDELAAARVEMIGELVWANELFDDPNMEGFGWFFFRGPDGNAYVIQQDSRPDAA
jgi:hypothetical protein